MMAFHSRRSNALARRGMVATGQPWAAQAGLRARGQDVVGATGLERLAFGAGQVIRRDGDTGVLVAGSDPRRDGCAVGW